MASVLLHGNTIAWDEIVFGGVALVILGVLIYLWFSTRGFAPDYEDDEGDEQT